MLTFVMGGSKSGKSAFSEGLFPRPGPHYYIATMEAFDEECRRRIQNHRAQRAGLGFETIERPHGLLGLTLPQKRRVLLEDMGNLIANELFSPQGAGEDTVEAVLMGIHRLMAQSESLVVVSNEVFLGGDRYAGDTLRYLRVLADVNRALAARAHRAVEVVCGLPIYHKGGPV